MAERVRYKETQGPHGNMSFIFSVSLALINKIGETNDNYTVYTGARDNSQH